MPPLSRCRRHESPPPCRHRTIAAVIATIAYNKHPIRHDRCSRCFVMLARHAVMRSMRWRAARAKKVT
jgi:hypothetical protein